MYKNIFFSILSLLVIAACTTSHNDWYGEYGDAPTGAPSTMMYGTPAADTTTHNIAVLLPLSGDYANIGRTIQTSIETSVLQRAPQNLSVAFYDTAQNNSDAISTALATNPDIIIGPVFAPDAKLLRATKPETLPVLSFTSDADAIGDGVMTMALMPTNGIEEIMREMKSDKISDYIIIAPNTPSGRLMAGAARESGDINDINIRGIFYYNENDSESIKNAAIDASMNTARTAANNRARAVLSDILTNETLTAIEKSSISIQLDKLSKSETMGDLPYGAVLFLGNGDDTETLASFLRYYGVGARDAKFYGTPMWDGSDITNDFTMAGAKYAALPESSAEFANIYQMIYDTTPSHLATFGYDAINMAMGMIYSQKDHAAYLLDPSGYIGIDGLFRLRPSGVSERALRIVQLDGSGTPKTVRNAAENFMIPIYNLDARRISDARPMALETSGINPNNYVRIPERFRSKYTMKTFGANLSAPQTHISENVITVLPEDDSDVIISPEFQPSKLETVNRTYIDSVEISE